MYVRVPTHPGKPGKFISSVPDQEMLLKIEKTAKNGRNP
jgi:hypothetical protein